MTTYNPAKNLFQCNKKDCEFIFIYPATKTQIYKEYTTPPKSQYTGEKINIDTEIILATCPKCGSLEFTYQPPQKQQPTTIVRAFSGRGTCCTCQHRTQELNQSPCNTCSLDPTNPNWEAP